MDRGKVQQALEHEAQRIEERIPMTMLEVNRTEQKLYDFMKSHGWSNAEAARRLNVSPAVISQYLKNKYKGDVAKLTNKVVNLINSVSRSERQRGERPNYVETAVATKVAALITTTEGLSADEGKIGLIIGDGGHGKSKCMQAYAEANLNSIYVQLDDHMTMASIYSEIAAAAGLAAAGTAEAVSRRIIYNLRNRQMVVMLDEASSLKPHKLNSLRQTIVVKAACPLILAGNHGLLDTVMQPTTRQACASLDQFTSRLMQILDLDAIASTGRNGGGLYTVEDIKKLYQYGGLRLTSQAVTSLQKICRTPRSGRLRTCCTVISALHLAESVVKAGKIEAADIVQAIDELGLPVRVFLPLATREIMDDIEDSLQEAVTA